jgi:hypothetical protein
VWGPENVRKPGPGVKSNSKNIRAADAKEVGVGNPAEETYCYPNTQSVFLQPALSTGLPLILIHFFSYKTYS